MIACKLCILFFNIRYIYFSSIFIYILRILDYTFWVRPTTRTGANIVHHAAYSCKKHKCTQITVHLYFFANVKIICLLSSALSSTGAEV